MVARLVWDQKVAGSNPVTPTTALGIGPIVDARTLSLTKRIIRTVRGGILYLLTSPSGEIGRHKGLKIPRHVACRFESGDGDQGLRS